MTVIYNGNDIYSLAMGNRTIVLNSEEIEKIQSYNFDTGEEMPNPAHLEQRVLDLEDAIRDLEEDLDEE